MAAISQTLGVRMIDAVAAYRAHSFALAIALLLQVLDEDPFQWRARFYLAMSYFHVGEHLLAVRHLRSIEGSCTDAELRHKATSALAVLTRCAPDTKVS